MSAHFFKEYVNEATGLRFNERLQYSAVCTNFEWFFIILVFGNVRDTLLQHYSKN